ncbi:hypothetical protein B0H19DRAFT_1073602 [Mycena capillaripes]|nr:hypothetical protein B0H19DRAFT_1073602 [Mycena capillaripes]
MRSSEQGSSVLCVAGYCRGTIARFLRQGGLGLRAGRAGCRGRKGSRDLCNNARLGPLTPSGILKQRGDAGGGGGEGGGGEREAGSGRQTASMGEEETGSCCGVLLLTLEISESPKFQAVQFKSGTNASRYLSSSTLCCIAAVRPVSCANRDSAHKVPTPDIVQCLVGIRECPPRALASSYLPNAAAVTIRHTVRYPASCSPMNVPDIGNTPFQQRNDQLRRIFVL